MEDFSTTVNLADTDIPDVHNIRSVCTHYASNLMSQQLQLTLRMYLKMVVFTEDIVATRWLKPYQTSVVTDDSSYHDLHMIYIYYILHSDFKCEALTLGLCFQ